MVALGYCPSYPLDRHARCQGNVARIQKGDEPQEMDPSLTTFKSLLKSPYRHLYDSHYQSTGRKATTSIVAV